MWGSSRCASTEHAVGDGTLSRNGVRGDWARERHSAAHACPSRLGVQNRCCDLTPGIPASSICRRTDESVHFRTSLRVRFSAPSFRPLRSSSATIATASGTPCRASNTCHIAMETTKTLRGAATNGFVETVQLSAFPHLRSNSCSARWRTVTRSGSPFSRRANTLAFARAVRNVVQLSAGRFMTASSNATAA